MRSSRLIPLAAALILAACGGREPQSDAPAIPRDTALTLPALTLPTGVCSERFFGGIPPLYAELKESIDKEDRERAQKLNDRIYNLYATGEEEYLTAKGLISEMRERINKLRREAQGMDNREVQDMLIYAESLISACAYEDAKKTLLAVELLLPL